MNKKERTSLISRLKMPAVRSPDLKVRTPAFQAGGIGLSPTGATVAIGQW